jgi:hypothetical protein
MTQQQGPDLKAINPANGPKFSPNLHKFLSSRRHQASLRLQRVYVDAEKRLWLGYIHDGLLTGARLMRVLTDGAKTETASFIGLGELVEVPEFWQKYQAFGRCAIDPEHRMPFTNDDTRWSIQGDRRSCLWCGQHHQRQQQRIVEEVRTEWVPAEPVACTA